MIEAVIILPHQLFKNHPAIQKGRTIYLVELEYFFNRFPFHKQKIALHYASMNYYRDYLKEKGYKIIYCSHKDIPTLHELIKKIKKDGIDHVYCTQLIEHDLEDKLRAAVKKNKIGCTIFKSPMFLTSEKLLKSFFDRKAKRFVMGYFYRKQRQELNILVDKNGRPVGGKWSFDELNRERLPENIYIPEPYQPHESSYTKAAKKYVERYYKNNPGEITFKYPVTHRQAEQALDDFLQKRLHNFGTYQDAISVTSSVLFHSQFSLLLNIGLLEPSNVVQKTLLFSKKHDVPINSLEGFIRQVIGWREFIYGIYCFHGKKQKKSNFWKNKRNLWAAWWKGKTEIDSVDMVIKRVLKTAYAHHIERLMILGNFMLLCEINPDDVYRWFMELFIDAYDWVMVPNVYGMSQYADGGLMATKPYISSSAYIKRMGTFKTGKWEKIWDALFWNFMYGHRNMLKKNARLARTLSLLKRMKRSTLEDHLKRARNYLKKYR